MCENGEEYPKRAGCVWGGFSANSGRMVFSTCFPAMLSFRDKGQRRCGCASVRVSLET